MQIDLPAPALLGAGRATPPPVKPSKRVPKWRRVPEKGVLLLRGHLVWPFTRKLIAVWCPKCRRSHTHGWNVDDGLPLSHVEYRVAHCSGPRLAGERTPSYAIGLTEWEQARIQRQRLDAKLAPKREAWQREMDAKLATREAAKQA